jgi:hypothetical protein
MSALQRLFGKYIIESSSDGGYSATISRPFFGWYRRTGAHEAARTALFGALARAFASRIVWDELDGLGLDQSWIPVAPKVREVPRDVIPKTALSLLESGGWLIYGSTGTPPLLTVVGESCEAALAAGAEVALSASFDSDRWELGARSSSLAIVERSLDSR